MNGRKDKKVEIKFSRSDGENWNYDLITYWYSNEPFTVTLKSSNWHSEWISSLTSKISGWVSEWESEMVGQTLNVSIINWKCVRGIKEKIMSILKFDGVKNKWNVCFLTDWLTDWLEIKDGTIKS